MEPRRYFILLIIFFVYIMMCQSEHLIYRSKPRQYKKTSINNQNVLLETIPRNTLHSKYKNICQYLKSHQWKNSFIEFISKICHSSPDMGFSRQNIHHPRENRNKHVPHDVKNDIKNQQKTSFWSHDPLALFDWKSVIEWPKVLPHHQPLPKPLKPRFKIQTVGSLPTQRKSIKLVARNRPNPSNQVRTVRIRLTASKVPHNYTFPSLPVFFQKLIPSIFNQSDFFHHLFPRHIKIPDILHRFIPRHLNPHIFHRRLIPRHWIISKPLRKFIARHSPSKSSVMVIANRQNSFYPKYNSLRSTRTDTTNQSSRFNESQESTKRTRTPFLTRKSSRIKRSIKNLMGKRNDHAWMDQNGYRELFKKYYKCLDRKVAEVKGEIDNAIKPVLLIVGQSVELKCDICMRPDQNADSLGIDWQMLRKADGKMKHVDFNKRKRMKMLKDYTLHINEAAITDAGQYFCVVQNNYASVFQVDILLNEKRRILHEGQKGQEPEEEFILEDKNLRVSTVWTSWSFCDRCGDVGNQRKMGLCMVKKHDKNSPIKPIDFPMIDLYPDGIPCHSTALPKFIKRIPDIRDRPSETMIRDCIQLCPTTPGPINITDKAGKLIEVLEPGFYSLHHPPTLPPITQRKVVYEDAGKHLILSCPKRLNKVITVWKRGKNTINPLTIRRITRNRVFLDQASRLHIRKLLLSDTSVYLCFLKQEHVASFKVIVYEPLNEQLKDYISLFGMFLTCFCVVIICICLAVKKSKKTQK